MDFSLSISITEEIPWCEITRSPDFQNAQKSAREAKFQELDFLHKNMFFSRYFSPLNHYYMLPFILSALISAIKTPLNQIDTICNKFVIGRQHSQHSASQWW